MPVTCSGQRSTMSCFDSHEDQLYLLDVTVESLQLTAEKVYECDKRPLLVKIKYLDLPIFVVSPGDFEPLSPSGNETKNGRMVFSSGRSCLFARRPKTLVREMQTTKFNIGVFCSDETYPIAQVDIQISGCLCDQIAMALNDKDHLPRPFVIKDCYRLVDPGENHSGEINIEVRIIFYTKNSRLFQVLYGNSRRILSKNFFGNSFDEFLGKFFR